MADVSRLTLKFDTDGVSRTRAETRSVSSELDGVSARADHAGSRFGALWKAAAAGVALIGFAAVGRGVASVIGQASDMNETISKTNAVFGNSAKGLLAWGDTAANSVGLSKQAALESAATIGNLLKGVGVANTELPKMSESLVQTAGDLGSFNNVDPAQVLEDLRSGLVGEAEPLRKYGILLSESAVKEKAMEMGLADANGELSESAKVQARYALIMGQTGDAQGDFAKTSKGLANSTRILKAHFKDLQARIGKGLLPTVTKITNAFNAWFTDFDNFPLAGFVRSLGDMAGAFFAAFGSGVKVNDLVKKFPEPLQKAAKAALLVADGFGYIFRVLRRDGLGAALGELPDILGQIFDGLKGVAGQGLHIALDFAGDIANSIANIDWGAVGTALVAGVGTAWQFVKDHPGEVAAFVLWGPLGVAVYEAVTHINWAPVASALADGFSRAFAAIPWGDIRTGVASFFTNLWTSFQNFDYNNLGLIVGEGIRAAVIAVGPTVMQVAGELLTSFKTGLENHWQDIIKWFLLWPLLIPAAIVGAAVVLVPKAYEFMKGFLTGLGLNWDTTVVPWLKSIPGMAATGIGDVSTALVAKGTELLTSLKTGADTKFAEIWAWVVALPDVMFTGIGDVTGTLTTKGNELLTSMKTGMDTKFAEIWSWVVAMPGVIYTGVGDLTTTLYDKGGELLDGLWDGATSQWDYFTEWLGGIGASIAEWVGDLAGVLYGAGADLIQGLINGIQDRIPGLQAAVSVVNSLVDLIDRGHSPWPMMIDAGRDAIDGLIIGMNNRTAALSRSVAGVNGAMSIAPRGAGLSLSPSSSSGASRAAIGAGGGGVTYVFVGSVVGGDIDRWIDSKVAAGQGKRIDRSVSRSRLAESY